MDQANECGEEIMNGKRKLSLPRVIFILVFIAGCAGEQAFTTSARPGETIAVAVGWYPNLTRSNLTVQITDANGTAVTYNPGEPHVRALIQGYPDPVSKLVVSDRAQVSYAHAGLPVFDGSGTNAPTYAALGPSFGNNARSAAGGSNNWLQTIVYLDLPTTLVPGQATVRVLDASGARLTPYEIMVDVLPGASVPINSFTMENLSLGALLRAGEQAPHFNVAFSGPSGVIPHSLQIDFVRTLGTSGTVWVTHSRGDIQNIMWTDNGSLLKAMLTPAQGVTDNLLSDFNFYVTGAVTSLTVNSVKAYDISGNPLSGFTAGIQQVSN
jgi:hypothetical protein